MIRKLLFAALLSTAAAAHAGDKPLYQPVPDWVKPAPPIDATAIKDDAPVILQLDTQQRLKNGEVWNYTDAATRAASQQVLDAIGTLKFPWLPDKGDLIVHKLEIIRGAEHIDLLASGAKLSVLRREEGLEQRQLNGLLTATMPVEGLRVGDVLHVVASVTQKDAALGGNVQTLNGVLADPVRVQFARVRLLWPQGEKIAWKTNATGAVPQITDAGGYHQLEFRMPLAKQPEMPGDAPVRYRGPRLIEASSFADWASISKIMAPLYKTDGLIADGSPLAAEVAKIKAAESDPLKRTELALELVQGKIRYLFQGMDGGNYMPQSPAQTWSLRYGDCKAKTLLLVALLRALGVEAEPVLASSQLGDMVPGRLPLPAAFDHVLVRATIGADVLWLDGTSSGARLVDIHDTPPFGWVLPVRAAGAEPIRIPFHPAARADARVDLALDESAGVGMPAPMKITAVYRGPIAQMIHAASQQAGKEDIDKFATTLLSSFYGEGKVVTRSLKYDETTGEMTVAATGIAYPDWNKEEERYRVILDKTLAKLAFEPDRARAAWRDIPVMAGNDGNLQLRTTIILPDSMTKGGAGFTLDGAEKLSDTLAGVRIERTTSVAGGVLTIENKAQGTRMEIAPADIAAERARVSRAKTHLLRENAPAGYPALWQVVETGKKAKRFDALLALYRQDITARPDKADPLTDLAWFHEKLYLRREAIDDLTKAIAIDPDAGTYLKRARLLAELGDRDKAAADIAEARKIDPGSSAAATQLAQLEADRGHLDAALELLDDRIAEGGKEKNAFLSTKATILSESGDKDRAISTIDGAIAASPGNADLLNARCWVKGTLNVGLDTALKDCSRAIELGDSGSAALDSRAMVFFRMTRFDDALADLNAAIDRDPGQASSWFLRGVIHKQMGDAKTGQEELAAARLMQPTIDSDYAKFGIKP
ncbi:DUF3857 domain-containing protein [Sphingomonas immobilis]|uniref:Tetratricopeptide repeat protein n=1 Tax=Sphingomonas immobilis TaxID=3063997 RepID=A0ABT8ZYE6_9SPHN|nr:DUF3857 domain-containing protein [Sphingomonas sp. CA1-15]MDO7842591.1 tetratricopeptide repeat protein [Sphingomonas sp. CA1-15]